MKIINQTQLNDKALRDLVELVGISGDVRITVMDCPTLYAGDQEVLGLCTITGAQEYLVQIGDRQDYVATLLHELEHVRLYQTAGNHVEARAIRREATLMRQIEGKRSMNKRYPNK